MNIHKAVEKELETDAKEECTLEFAQFLLIQLCRQADKVKVPKRKVTSLSAYKRALISAERELDNICND